MIIIYLSGIDGCGKTTQSKLLVNALRNKNIEAEYVWLRWEPSARKYIGLFKSIKTGRHNIGHSKKKTIENAQQEEWLTSKRKILSNPIIRKLWLLYASSDYYYRYQKLFSNLTAQVLVIDRYVYDFIIDQAINMGISPENCPTIMNNFFLKKFRFPDYNIIINIPAQEGYNRKNDGTALNYLKNRAPYYQNIFTPGKTKHFDGLEEIEILSNNIQQYIFSELSV